MLKFIVLLTGLTLATQGLAEESEWFGAPGDPAAEPVLVSEVISQVDALEGRALTVSGRITDVCTNRGCWAVFEDQGEMLRIKVRDHAFALPAEARGAAIAHGILERVEISPEHARHLVEADGADRGLLDQDHEYRLITDGIRLTP